MTSSSGCIEHFFISELPTKTATTKTDIKMENDILRVDFTFSVQFMVGGLPCRFSSNSHRRREVFFLGI